MEHHCEIEHDHQMKILMLVSFRSTAFYSNLVHILQRYLGPCHVLIWFLNSANVIGFFISYGRSFNIFAPLYRNEFEPYVTVLHFVYFKYTVECKL